MGNVHKQVMSGISLINLYDRKKQYTNTFFIQCINKEYKLIAEDTHFI